MNEITQIIRQQMNRMTIIEGPQGPTGPQGPKGDTGADGTGLLVFSTLSALQAALPNGSSEPVWVTAENSWYYWSGEVPAPDTTAPTVGISPTPGTYAVTQSVTLTANEPATIYYTTDGSTPTTSSTSYSGAISVPATATIKYFARDTAGNSSTVQTASYTINEGAPPDTTAPNPVTSLSAGTPTSTSVPLSWTLSTSGDVSTQEVAYSTDGTNFTIANAAVSAAANSYTVTGLSASTAYTFRVVAKDAANNRSTAVTTAATTAATANFTTSGLKVWLDAHDGTGEQTAWTDKSSNANNATLTNFNFDATDGWQTDGSLKGDGTNDYVVTNGNLGLTGSGQARTVQFKVKINSMTDKAILGFGSGTSGYFDVLLYQNNICVYEGTIVSSVKQAATNGSTYDIAFVYNGTALTMYLNGVLQSGSFTKLYNTLDSPLYLLQGGGSGFKYSANQLYYVAVYNRALTESEVLANYNAYAG